MSEKSFPMWESFFKLNCRDKLNYEIDQTESFVLTCYYLW